LSPLVQRTRAVSARRTDPTDQHWTMLMFESLSGGVLAVGIGLVAVLVVVGVYLLIVWPLTTRTATRPIPTARTPPDRLSNMSMVQC